jgi:hypothetical protein
MKLSKNFTLAEFTSSATATRLGIDNSHASIKQILNLAHLCHQVLQPLRNQFGTITISSGLRCQELNSAVGGSTFSQHLYGEAADISLPSKDLGREYFTFLQTLPEWDQLIWEQANNACWIHVSIHRLGTNRKQVLWITR